MTFTEFVSFYELARTEGIVLRYLAGAYKALEHTVPDDLKSEDFQDLIAWLGELVRQVDSSLLDEWEQLANPEEETRGAGRRARRPGQAGHRQRAAPSGCWCATRCSAGSSWPRWTRYERARRDGRGVRLGRGRVGATPWTPTGTSTTTWAPAPTPAARSCCRSRSSPSTALWRVRQTFADPNGDHDWGISAEVDLAASDEEGRAVVRVTDVGQL